MMILTLLFACAGPTGTAPAALPDRAPGERSPLTATCDEQDEVRCSLPWPSNTFARRDDSTPTGLRLAVEPEALPGEDDDPAYLNLGDGFSRISPIATAFEGRIDGSFLPDRYGDALSNDAPIQLLVAQPDHPDYGTRLPIWAEITSHESTSAPKDLLIAYPATPMPAAADMVVVVTRELGNTEGAAFEPSRATEVALGLVEPINEWEEALVAYHAPTRLLLDDSGIATSDVLRVWDFTTRSDGDVTGRLTTMLESVPDALSGITVEIDAFVETSDPAVLGIVLGTLHGVPSFLDEEDRLARDDSGVPQQQGTIDAPFRVVIPATGMDGGTDDDYRVAMYGHGTGGSVTDNAFDADIAEFGVSKVNLNFRGWTGDDLVFTFVDIIDFQRGTEKSTARLLQSLVDGYAILRSLDGPLGDALSAEQIGGVDNPAVGRRPSLDHPVWVGGSLGGTMGAVIGSAWPEVKHAVLNVPASGWTHMVPTSLMYETALRGLLVAAYDTEFDVRLGMLMSQGVWDDVDGATWADHANSDGAIFLLQQSMEDPIVPNVGTHLLARSFGATMVGPALQPLEDLPAAAEAVTNTTGITQFRVPDSGFYDVHGFAARDTPAGEAALEQILYFLQTSWEDSPEVAFPKGCSEVTPDGSCDFSEVWSED